MDIFNRRLGSQSEKLILGAGDARDKYRIAQQQRIDDEKARQAQEFNNIEVQKRIDSGELNVDGTEKEGPSNLWEHLASFGTDFAAGAQQAGGSFLDALVQGGQLVEQLGNESNPFIDQTKRNERVRTTDQSAGALRDAIGDMKDVRGNNIDNRRTDEAAARIASGDINARDLAALTGRAIGDATTATMLLNPVSTAGRAAAGASAGARIASVAKFAGKEALAFGAVDATAAGLETAGAGGGLGESLGAAGTAGLMSGVAQVGLNVGGKVVGDAIGSSLRGISGKSKNVAGAVSKTIKELPDAALSTPGLVDKINELAGTAKTVGELRRELSKFTNSLDAPNAPSKTGPIGAKTPASILADTKLAEVDSKIKAIQDGDDDSVFKYTTSDGSDVTAQVRDMEDQIRQKQSQIRDLQQQAEGIDNNTGRADAPEGVDPSEFTGDVQSRTAAAAQVKKLTAEVQELATNLENSFTLGGGIQRTIDTELARAKMKELSSERADAISQRDKTDTSLTADDVRKIASDIDNGVVPQEFIATRSPVDNSADAARRSMEVDTEDSIGIQEAYATNAALRSDAEEQLSRLMTQDDYFRERSVIDQEYKIREAAAKELPKPDMERQIAELDAEYTSSIGELEARLDADAPRAAELEQAIAIADQIDGNIIDEWNSMEASNPSAFGVVDTDGLQRYRESLDEALAERQLKGDPNNVDAAENANAVETLTSGDTTVKKVSKKLDSDDDLGTAANTVAADALTSGNTGDVSIIDYNMRAPRTWIKRWGTAGKEILDSTDKAIADTNRFNGDIQNRSRKNDWGLSFKKKYMDDVVDFLNEGKEIKQRPMEGDAHFAKRLQSANDIKKWLQETGRKLGLPEDVVTRNYLPHMIERKTGLKMDRIAADLEMIRTGKNANGKNLTDAQTAKLMKGLESVDTQTRLMIASKRLYKYDAGILKKRRGAEGWSRNLPEIVSEYARQSTNELYMKPALEKMKTPMAALEASQLDALDDFVRVWRGEPITRWDKGISKARVPGTNITLRQLSSGSRRLQNVALMGGSARTVALQVFGTANIYAESTSTASFMQSGLRALSANKKGAKLKEEFYAEGGMHGSFSGYLTGESGLVGAFSKTEKVMYSGIQFVDENMRMWAYDMGKHDYAKSLGKRLSDLNPEELAAAKKFGVEKANATQFSTDVLDVPLGQTTDLGKMLTQIQQFNIKQTDYNFKLFVGGDKSMFRKGSDGDTQFSEEGAKRMVKSLVAHAVMIGTLTSAASAIFGEEYEKVVNVLGLDWDDAIPFGDQAKSVYDIMTGKADASISFSTPLLSAILGSDKGMGAVDFAKSAYNYAAGNIDNEEFGNTMAKLPKFLVRNFLPGGTQGVRTGEGYMATQSGESRNDSGSTRFLVNNKDGWNVMKGLMGGQYATDEGQEWLRNGMNTISKKYTVSLPDGSKVPVSEYARDNLSREDQAQFIQYYATKQNADKQLAKNNASKAETFKSIKSRLQSGIITRQQAEREVQKWNSQLLNLYAPYLSNNKSIPPRLSDDLMNNSMITIQNVSDLPRAQSARDAAQNQSYYDSEN